MNVLALTIFVGFVLVGMFVLLFVTQAFAAETASERDALLPLEPDLNEGLSPSSPIPTESIS